MSGSIPAPPLHLHGPNGRSIVSVEDWFHQAPPARGLLHWKDGRSAKESAKAWLRTGHPTVPLEILAVLNTHPLTQGFIGAEAIPEAVIRLDDLAGGQRNADVLLIGKSPRGKVLVTVEAKVDESFGELIGPYYDDHPRPKSRLQDRIDSLASAIFTGGLDDRVRGMRYQLLHATAATLIEAARRGATVAVFLVHVFETPLARAGKLIENQTDWNAFRSLLAPDPYWVGDHLHEPQMDGIGKRLYGPYAVPGDGWVPPGMPLLLGYCKVKQGLERLTPGRHGFRI